MTIDDRARRARNALDRATADVAPPAQGVVSLEDVRVNRARPLLAAAASIVAVATIGGAFVVGRVTAPADATRASASARTRPGSGASAATANGSATDGSTAPAAACGGTLTRIGENQVRNGVTIRTYRVSFGGTDCRIYQALPLPAPEAAGADPAATGGSDPATVAPSVLPAPVPDVCHTGEGLQVGYSTDAAVGTQFAGTAGVDTSGPITFLSTSLFGSAEGAPVITSISRVGDGVASVRAEYKGRAVDEATPVAGWAVTVFPPPDGYQENESEVTLIALDGNGRELGKTTTNTQPRLRPECDPNALPAPTGPPPADEPAARDAVTHAVETVFSADSTPEDFAASVEDGAALLATRDQVLNPNGAYAHSSATVDEIVFLDATSAAVRFSISYGEGNGGATGTYQARATLHDGHWVVTRDSACQIVSRVGAQCP